jgi:hypothetical protein
VGAVGYLSPGPDRHGFCGWPGRGNGGDGLDDEPNRREDRVIYKLISGRTKERREGEEEEGRKKRRVGEWEWM